MIFMNFRARSSRATGPKMRVPMGSRSLLMSTAEFPSNLMKLPSARPTSRLVRTMTALATSPFFTLLFGSASRTETTMMSPMLAYFRFEPPSTLMQNTFLAPELSATSSTLVIWIMVDLPSLLARPALEHLDHPPALVLAGGPGLGDAHPVTLVEGRVLRVVVVLGVRLVLLAQRQDLSVFPVCGPAPHGHHHRLLHLVAGDDAGAGLGAPAVAAALGRAALFRGLGHVRSSPQAFAAAAFSFWVMTVRIRARSRRLSARFAGDSSAPVRSFSRSLNSDWRSSAARRLRSSRVSSCNSLAVAMTRSTAP